jgi:hypothetical protein
MTSPQASETVSNGEILNYISGIVLLVAVSVMIEVAVIALAIRR